MLSVEEFLAKNPIKKTRERSRLFAFEREIKLLRKQGASYVYIQSFLAANDVKTSIENIRQFLIRTEETQSNVETEKPATSKKSLTEQREEHPKHATEAQKAPVKVETPTEQEKQQEEAIQSRVANYVPPSWAKGTKIEDLL